MPHFEDFEGGETYTVRIVNALPPHSLPRKGQACPEPAKGLGMPFLEHYRLCTHLDPGSGTNSVWSQPQIAKWMPPLIITAYRQVALVDADVGPERL